MGCQFQFARLDRESLRRQSVAKNAGKKPMKTLRRIVLRVTIEHQEHRMLRQQSAAFFQQGGKIALQSPRFARWRMPKCRRVEQDAVIASLAQAVPRITKSSGVVENPSPGRRVIRCSAR